MSQDLIDPQTGEILAPDLSTMEVMTRAEIDALVSTAKKYPRRRPAAIRDLIKELAIMDQTTAEEMRYALPRGGKTINGPSIRFAEMAAQQFGNCQIGSRVTEINKKDKFVEAEGVFIDSEANVRQVARVRRRIVDKQGRVFNDDMILITCNAAASIARRNAILAGVPKAIWAMGYEEAERVVMGDVKTLSNTRATAIAAFTNFGMTQDQVFELVGAEKIDDIGLEGVADLRTMYRQLKNQETTVEDLTRLAKGGTAPPAHEITANPLADDDGPAPNKGKANINEVVQQQFEDGLKAAPATETKAEPEKPASEPEKKPAAPRKKKEAAPVEAESNPLPESTVDDDSVDDLKISDAERNAEVIAEPKNEAEYAAYARAWIAKGDTPSDMMDRWKAERRTRNECSVTGETLEELKAALDEAIGALG